MPQLSGSGDSCILTQEILFITLFTKSGTAPGGDDEMNIRNEWLFLKRSYFAEEFCLFLLNFKLYKVLCLEKISSEKTFLKNDEFMKTRTVIKF